MENGRNIFKLEKRMNHFVSPIGLENACFPGSDATKGLSKEDVVPTKACPTYGTTEGGAHKERLHQKGEQQVTCCAEILQHEKGLGHSSEIIQK